MPRKRFIVPWTGSEEMAALFECVHVVDDSAFLPAFHSGHANGSHLLRCSTEVCISISLSDTDFIKLFSLPDYAMLLIHDNGSQIHPVLDLLKETHVGNENKAVIKEHLESHITISKGRYFEEHEIEDRRGKLIIEIETITKEIIKSLDE